VHREDPDSEEKQFEFDPVTVGQDEEEHDKSSESDSSGMFHSIMRPLTSNQMKSRSLSHAHQDDHYQLKQHLEIEQSQSALTEHEQGTAMTAKLNSINVDGIGQVSTNTDRPIIINVHHKHHLVGDAQNQSRRSLGNENDEVDTSCLPKLPPEYSDTETVDAGEGFNLNEWIKQTLQQCAPQNKEWMTYWANFQKHRIDEDTLIVLGTDKQTHHEVWKELIPIIGPRIRFQEAWAKELTRQQRLKL